jgi:DNA-3-methyladenine glycosylase
MAASRRLSRRFFSRPSADVAPDLLGRVLVRTTMGGDRLAARIVETEAYEEGDPASHSFRGSTPRTAVMFGPPGFLYVYFTYGMHFCMNVVTGRAGEGSAVLLRAGEPLEGIEEMRLNRGGASPRMLCAGPARFTRAMRIDRAMNGIDLALGREAWIEPARRIERLSSGPRVGIRTALDRPWRFWVTDSPFVSRPSATATARR